MFSSMAVVIHLILNFKLLMGKGTAAVYGARYRAFLFGILGIVPRQLNAIIILRSKTKRIVDNF